MKNFLSKNRMTVFIVILAIGSISIIGTNQFVLGQDGSNLNGSVIGCVYAACKNTNIGGSPSGAGGSNTATLTVTKEVHCAPGTLCPLPSLFNIHIIGNNPSPESFQGSATGTTVTLGPGAYKITESAVGDFVPSFSGDCAQDDSNPFAANGFIGTGETQTCSILNDNGVM